jgi:hypothetical protein
VAITIVDTYAVPGTGVSYDAGEADVCGFGFDLSQGQVLVATDAQNVTADDASCKGAIAELAPSGGWTWTLSGTQSTASRFLFAGEYEGSDGSCMGHVQMNLVVNPDAADPFAPSVPGQVPNVYLERTFSGSSAGCLRNCVGAFLVTLQRL